MSSYFDYHCKQLEISARRDIEQAECIKGTCYTMCPEEEAKLREKMNMVHVLEVVGPTRKLVKSYSRSAADTNLAVPKLLRPYMVLHDTVQYLILEVSKRTDVPSSVVYDFVTDRLRAVRQDMTVQRMTSEQCVNLLEPMIRFHVYYGYKLQDYPLKDYDPVLNKKYLLECLKWFLSCYNTIDQRQGSQNGAIDKLSETLSNLNFRENVSCNRILMESLYILCNLEDVHPLVRYLNLPKDLKREPILNKAYEIALANLKGNYLRVCQLMDELCPLTYCALCTYLPTIQRRALLVMSHAYNSKRLSVPMELLARWLRFPSEREAWHACKHYGLTAESNAVTFDKGQFRTDVLTHQGNTQLLKTNLDLSIDNIFTYKPS